MYEHKRQPLASNKKLVQRMLLSTLLGLCILIVSLSVGVLGYHFICSFDWVDAILNASMILSGMGPTNPITNNAGKLFASFYAIFSGVIFISTIGIILAPIIHRLFHHLVIEEN